MRAGDHSIRSNQLAHFTGPVAAQCKKAHCAVLEWDKYRLWNSARKSRYGASKDDPKQRPLSSSEAIPAKMRRHQWLWQFVQLRECLIPTWRGWLVIALFGIALIVTGGAMMHSFLAAIEPVPARVLVVEGWVPDYALEKAKAEFERSHYIRLYVTGGPLQTGGHLSQYRTYAEIGVATLIRMGMREDTLEPVPAPPTDKDRTYISALTLRNRLRQHDTNVRNINVVSMGAHARRTRLLFQKAFGTDSQVGVIAVEDRDYDPSRWWQYSQGVRTVIGELVAYTYARAVFPFVQSDPVVQPGARAN